MNLPQWTYRLTDILIFLGVTTMALLHGHVTIFYLLYLFWFEELIRILLFFFAGRRFQNSGQTLRYLSRNALFILFIYLVFIVIVFGAVIDFSQIEKMAINYRTLLFRNIYFNISISLFTIQLILFIYANIGKVNFGSMVGFNERHFLLHISIIAGAFLWFFVVRKNNTIFTVDNPLSSILIASPFLLLRILFNPGFLTGQLKDQTAEPTQRS